MAERSFIESRQEMEQILAQEGLGFLGLTGPDGPYVVPLNYAYADGRIVFHCALKGRKLDCIRSHPAVCFCVARQSGKVKAHFGTKCHVDNESVTCFGRARIVEEAREKERLLNAFNRRFQPDAPDVPAARIPGCAIVEIRVTEMTGRRERDRKVAFWRWRFGTAG